MNKELIISTVDLATQVDTFTVTAKERLEESMRAEIVGQETFDKGTDYRKIVKAALERIDEKRKDIIGDYWRRMKFINAEFKKVTDILGNADGIMNGKMLTWYKEEESRLEAVAAEEKRQAEEQALRAAEAAEKAGEHSTAEAIVELSVNTPAVAKRTVGRGAYTGAGSHGRKTWKGKIADDDDMSIFFLALAAGELPRDMVEIKQSKLDAYAREIAEEGISHGITITHKTGLAVR